MCVYHLGARANVRSDILCVYTNTHIHTNTHTQTNTNTHTHHLGGRANVRGRCTIELGPLVVGIHVC